MLEYLTLAINKNKKEVYFRMNEEIRIRFLKIKISKYVKIFKIKNFLEI